MRKVAEYQGRAEDCRRPAAKAASDQERKALDDMAAAWELLAKTRQEQLEKGLVQPAF
jgi:hypothetical protein